MDALHRPLFLPDVLVNALSQDPQRPLLHLLGGPTLTVGDVRDATSQYVQALASLGVDRRSRIAMLSSNRPEVLHVGHAAQLLATVYVALHPLGGAADQLHVLKDAEIDILVFDAERHGERAAALAREVPGLRLVGLGASELADDLCRLAATFAPLPLQAPVVEPSDITRISYSGGTTGKPKSMTATQQVGMACLTTQMSEWEWPSPPRVLSCAPLSHAGVAMILPTLIRGGELTVMPGFDPLAVMRTIQERRINCMMMVPTMIYALLDHPRLDEFDLSSLETVFYGASPMSPARLKEAIERIGPVFAQFYGQAEAPMVITYFRKADHDANDLTRLASCGRPTPWITLALLDSKNWPVPDGEPGEICVRGPLVFNGYRNNPDLTAQTFAGGWHHTGDVALRDPGGFLRIIDRTKDMIISGGFNIYPREIEDILGEHPAVAQSAVIGMPHPKWGEAVKAVVVLRPGRSASAEELIAMVASRKGSYQAPKTVDFAQSIPQTPVGKPDKKALKAGFATTPAS